MSSLFRRISIHVVALALLSISAPVLAQNDIARDSGLEPGSHAVGFEVLREYDRTRTYRPPRDAEGRAQDNVRPMLIGVWYPALAGPGDALTFGDYVDLVTEVDGFAAVTDADRQAARNRWATVEDRIVPELLEVLERPMWGRSSAPRVSGSFPTVLYSPGGGGSLHENAVLFEFLASHGYVVAAIPSFWLRAATRSVEQFDLSSVEAGTRDLEFVAARMASYPNADALALGTLSYSWGGLADIAFANRNHNVAAIVSLDGGIGFGDLLDGLDNHPRFAPETVGPPLLHLVGKELVEGDRFWRDFHPRLPHDRWTVLEFGQLRHADFSSATVLENVNQPDTLTATERATKLAGIGLAARHTLGFFDAVLKGRDGWSPAAGVVEEHGIRFTVRRRESGAEPSAATRADFDALVGYFASGSATWQQDNADPRSEDATHWVRRHSRGTDSSTAEVVAVYADGRCEPVTTFEYRWSEADKSISSSSRTANGLSFRGSVEPLGGSRYRTTVEGDLPDGTRLQMRDTTDLTVPGSSTTTAERWVDGGWVPLDAATWRQVPASAWCAAE